LAQTAFGAVLRHFGHGFWLHVAGAATILMIVLWQAAVIGPRAELRGALGRSVGATATLAIAQIGLGLASAILTGLAPPGVGPPPTTIEALTTALHVVFGALLLASAVTLCMNARRRLAVRIPWTAPAGATTIGGAK
jgi:hypothetical protein